MLDVLVFQHSSGRPLLAVTGVLEAVTGLGLLVAPSEVVKLLLGAALGSPAGATLGRVTGVALLALGVACWLGRNEAPRVTKGLLTALLLYNVGVVVVLVAACAGPRPVGIAFWPVVLAHAALMAWCVASLAMRT